MEPLVATQRIHCSSARDDIWLPLADTHQLNRATGNHPLSSEPLEEGASRYLVKTRLAGLNLEYEEEPFEWSRPHFFSITRHFRNGPSRRYKFELRLREHNDGGSLVYHRLEVEPRWTVATMFLFVTTKLISRRVTKEIKRIDANLASGAGPYAQPSKSRLDTVELLRATQALLCSLKDRKLKVGERLVGHITNAPDAELSRIRPFELADSWDIERRTVLSVCLEAVIAGLLELSWDIICPSCRTVAGQLTSLSELTEHAHCRFCDISINVELDRAVEATFRPMPAICALDNAQYCIGGPFRTPHVVAQALLPAGGTASVQTPNASDRYRLFVRGGATASVDVQEDAPTEVEVTAGQTVTPCEVNLAPRGRLIVHDSLKQERHIKLEHLEWASAAATALDVTMVDSFRQLFSAEVLRPGLAVKVSRLALLFTDLTDSTAMYARCGDAMAYRFVQEHFRVLEDVINDHRGGLVKTIGDSVLATFPDDRAAVEAGIGMQRAFREFTDGWEQAHDVELRIGVHAGACFTVNANNALDYFGQTVNIASRLQDQSKGGQILVSADIVERGRSSGWLEGVRVSDPFEANFRGVDTALAVVRLTLDE